MVTVKNSKAIILLTTTLALAVVGALLLTRRLGESPSGTEETPSVVQPQESAPALPTPALNSGTPEKQTPSPQLTSLATKVGETQVIVADTLTPITDIPSEQYPAPSGEWSTYTNQDLHYSFEYPSNWFIELEPGSTTIYLHNFSPGFMPKGELDPNRIKIIISHPKDGLNDYPSLEAYLSDPKHAAPPDELIEPQKLETLANGYQVAWQKRTAAQSNGGVLGVYITNGKEIYTLGAFSLNSRFLNVVDRVVSSFKIDESVVFTEPSPTTTPSPVAQYLEPSGEWAKYANSSSGYNFEYPSNWFVINEGTGTPQKIAIQNTLPEAIDVKGSESPNPNKIKIVIFPTDDMGKYKALEDYLDDPDRLAANPYSSYLKSEKSPNGYQVVWQQEALTETFLVVYISNGIKVFRIAAPASSNYISTVDRLVASFVIQ